MLKGCTICFQSNVEMKSALEKIAEEEQQTVSSIVEAVVFQYLKSKRGFQGIIQNRRKFNRKTVSFAVSVGDPQWKRRDFVKCKMLDISVGGLRFCVPKGTNLEIVADNKAAEYNVIFTLPDNFWSMELKVRSKRVLESEREVQVGAAFVSPDPSTSSQLEKYLLSSRLT